jgi:hypothetical protein
MKYDEEKRHKKVQAHMYWEENKYGSINGEMLASPATPSEPFPLLTPTLLLDSCVLLGISGGK